MSAVDALDRVRTLIAERGKTHGPDAIHQLGHAQALKRAIGHRENPNLTLAEKEAMDMIAVKLSRLVNGEPIGDHWDDIIGYAAIGRAAREIVTASADRESDVD